MAEAAWGLWAVIAIALLFDYINGMHDAANAIATVVSTRVLSPRQAILLSACLNFAGAFLSTAVADRKSTRLNSVTSRSRMPSSA